MQVPNSPNEKDGREELESPADFILKQKIAHLEEQNRSLKKQFEEAIVFSEQNEELTRKNALLENEIRKNNAKYDELQRRFEILSNQEEKPKDFDNGCEKNVQNEIRKAIEKYELDKERLLKQITSLNNQISERDDEITQLRMSNDSISGYMNAVLKAAQDTFKLTFPNASNFIDFMGEYQQNHESYSTTEIRESQLNELEDKNTALKQKYKEERERRINIEKKLNEVVNKKQNDQNNTNNQIHALEVSLAEAKSQHEKATIRWQEMERTYKQDLSKLATKITKLRSKVLTTEEKAKIEKASLEYEDIKQEINFLKKENRDLSSKLSESQLQEASYQKQAVSLSSQYNTLSLAHDALKKKYKSLSTEMSNLVSESDKLKMEKSSAELDRSSCEEEMKATSAKLRNAQIQIAKLQESNKLLESANEKTKQGLKAIEQTTESQRRELKELTADRGRMVSLIRQQNGVIQEAERIINSSRNESKSLRRALKQCEKTLKEETSKAPLPEQIPMTCWYNADFPRELCSQITDFARNEALDNGAKLKNALSTIARYYNSQFDQVSKKAKEVVDNHSQQIEIVDKLLKQLGSLFGASDLSFRSVFESPMAVSDIINRASKVVAEASQRESERERVEGDLLAILSRLEVSTPEHADKMITSLYKHINELQAALAEEKERSTNAKRLRRETEKDLVNINSELRSNVDKLEKDLDGLQEKSERLERQLKDRDYQLSSLQELLDNTQKSHLAEIERVREEYRGIVSESHASVEAEREARQLDKSKFEDEKGELRKRIALLEREVGQWKRSNQMIRNAKTEKEQQVKILLEQFEDAQRESRERSERERQSMKTQYEKCLADVKGQNSELKRAHEELSEALEQTQAKLVEASARINDLSAANDDLRVSADCARDDSARERKLLEMKQRSELLASEMRFNTALEDARSEFLLEKRKIIGYVAQTFRQFFNSGAELDDECLKEIIRRAREEMERLQVQETTIRRMLGLAPGASLEEAVSKYFVSLYIK